MKSARRLERLTCKLGLASTLAICAAAAPAIISGATELPAPTGAFRIGRVSFLCTDSSRLEPLAADHGPREVMVDVWYPAEDAGGSAAPYLDIQRFEQAIGADGLRKQLGRAYGAIAAAAVQTHASLRAPFAKSLGRTPVLIFSPGGGMVKELYASQLEDLASHGYIVAALTHSYDGFVSLLPDGRFIVYNSERWPKIPSVEGELNLNQLEWHARDICVVLEWLSSSAVSELPIAGHLDLARVGAFGHSLGGIVAARACQDDRRITACLNEDGAVAMRPFYLDARGWGMNQPFMIIERAPRTNPPSDRELAGMKLTRPRADALLDRLKVNGDLSLRRTGTESYRVLLNRDLTTHMDFSDLPILGALNGDEAASKGLVVASIRDYTRAFFDKFLLGSDSSLLDASPKNALIESVQHFGPSKRPE